MSYIVKVYNNHNATLESESPVMESYLEANQVFLATGSGEGYWAELHQVYPNYTVTLATSLLDIE